MELFTPKEYLKIDIASSFGLEKQTWEDRLVWFNDNEPNLEELVNVADEPALYYAGVKAWRAMQANEPIGYMISLDATSSGLQLLACLTGDRKAAELCNVVDTGKREDAYTNIYETMVTSIEEQTKISRDKVKDAIMTAMYGSKAVPKEVFGEGKLLDVFYKTMQEMAPAAWELNETFLAIWDSEAYSNDWILPDNFHVHIKVMNQIKETVHFLNQPFDTFRQVNMPVEEGRSLGANVCHSVDGMIVREMTARCNYDEKVIAELKRTINRDSIARKSTTTYEDKLVVTLWGHYNRTGFLSARILQYLNMDNLGHVEIVKIRELLESLPKKPFNIVSIHDCFRCHCNYGNDLREQYNRQLMLIAQSDLLGDIISQLIGKNVTIGKLDPKMSERVIESNYSLS